MLLEVENLHAGYGPIEVLKGITLRVEEGEIVAMIGANGAGKTSTLMTISGCVPATKGTVRFAGREIQSLPAHEIVRLGICHSPEGRKIFPRLSVWDNLQLGAYTRGDKAGKLDVAALGSFSSALPAAFKFPLRPCARGALRVRRPFP